MITQERLREVAHYNRKTGVFTALCDRGKIKKGDRLGSPCTKGYLRITIDWERNDAHRLAWLYVKGSFPKHGIDHRDGRTDNNRWRNLRCLSQGMNLQNQRRAHTNNKTGVLGVGRAASLTHPFRSRITVNGKETHLGRFKTIGEARSAYLTAKRRMHQACSI